MSCLKNLWRMDCFRHILKNLASPSDCQIPLIRTPRGLVLSWTTSIPSMSCDISLFKLDCLLNDGLTFWWTSKIHYFVHTDGAHCKSKVPLDCEFKDSWVGKVSMVLASPVLHIGRILKQSLLLSPLHFWVILLNDLYVPQMNAFVGERYVFLMIGYSEGGDMQVTCEVISELYLKPITILWLFLFHFIG